MSPDRWQLLSEWHNAWLAADTDERERLQVAFAADHPDLLVEADALAAASAGLPGFLETPALALVARDLDPETTLSADALVGPYRIVGLLARGGMGDVYRATDLRLQRDVALKVLAHAGTDDPHRIGRFLQEARITASLDHPHIVKIFDVGVLEGRPYLVAELLDGETLRVRLGQGRLMIEEARRIAGNVAAGLVAAHAAGLVHRDLKPDNIFLTRSGVTKILDFGIAKLAEGPLATDGLSTLTGVILGTAGYLSPEQIRGGVVDARTDLFALGSILFEMATGERAFGREHTIDTLHAIVHEDPSTLLQIAMPDELAAIVMRLLEKAPHARFQSAADLEWALVHAAQPSVRSASKAPPSLQQRAWMPWLLAGLVSMGAAASTWYARQAVPVELHLEVTTSPTLDTISLAMSPDGATIAFVGTTDGEPHLWLRWLGGATARSLAGTEHASLPFWSSDGKSVGFFADGRVKTIELESGTVRSVANAAFPSGGTWNRNGVILFVPNAGAPLSRVEVNGGDPARVVPIESPPQSNYRAPEFLPDGHHFLYYVTGAAESRGVYIGDLDRGLTHRLLDADSAAVYLAPGSLLFVRQGTLYAQAFDATRLSLSGNPSVVADGMGVEPVVRIAPIATSSSGAFAYRAGSPPAQRQFIWFDRAGRETEKLGAPDANDAFSPSLSPDGRRVVYYRTVDGNADIWTLDVVRGMLGRFTSSSANELNPIWSSDGRHIVYGLNRTGVFDIFQKGSDGSGEEQLLFESPVNKAPLDTSSDGRFLLYRTFDSKTSFDIWALPVTGKPFPVAQSRFAEREAKFSPDGRSVAYQSDESGRFEIYVQEFPGATNRMQVSTNGGTQVRWRQDGSELFYVGLDGRMMAVPITRSVAGALDSGTPVPLFLTRLGAAPTGPQKQQYDVSLDGQRFLINTLSQESSSPISVVLNWRQK